MTKKVFLALWALLLGALLPAVAQEGELDTYNINNANNGKTIAFDVSGNALGIYDNGGNGGRYTPGDYWLTVTSNCEAPSRFYLRFSELDIDCMDTLYFYDGADTNAPVRAKVNNCTGHQAYQQIFVSPSNASGTLTVRFKAADGSRGGTGFTLGAGCGTPCEDIYALIDTVFYRTRGGEVYDSARCRDVPVYDTVWNINADGDTLGVDYVDTNYFYGAHFCLGDGLILSAHGVYSNKHGYYNPTDATTYFSWDMAYDGDTLAGTGMNVVSYDKYDRTGCFDVTVKITDVFGCTSDILTTVKVRTSFNPIKTVFTIADICNNTLRGVTMGYDGDDATLTLRRIENQETVSKTNEVRTFIPDGPNCPGPNCYEAPVEFNEFPSGKKVNKAGDVCSICVNMEHTFMGDISVYIVCPNGSRAALFWGNYDPDRPNENRGEDGSDAHGSGTDMGYPLRNLDGNPQCDTLQNPFGGGLDYCWSRNRDYTLVTGDKADVIVGRPSGHHWITCTHQTYQIHADPPITLPTIPSYFTNGGGTSPTYSGWTKRPSDHAGKSDYYTPWTDFSELIGCPLNGTWKIEVCDYWGADNGWVFNWSLDICGVSQDNDCRYDVGIDSLIWHPNSSPQYHDYDLGRYRGLVSTPASSTLSYLSSPDTAGTFPIDVLVYDEFGCVWEAKTSITSYWTPQPNLGDDTTLCGVDTKLLDAKDRHSLLPTENYSYDWHPFGQTTDTITTRPESGDQMYVVEVTNLRRYTPCTVRDTVYIKQRKQPMPIFSPSPFTFEGCEPFTLTFENQSMDASTHLWDFGDGVTSTYESPTHTFAEGIYTLRYYATSDEGCVDSVIAENGIAVYPTPKPAFAWEPVYPSLVNPVVHFANYTEPQTPNTQYRWEIQYDPQNYPLSVHTLTDHTPTFNFADYAPREQLAGDHSVRLIAFTENVAPTGNIVRCRDTAENKILIINDYLQFPNVVTPNGDGINDRFVIKNLISGYAFPTNQLDIYNRWGTRVFHAENISKDEDFWDPSDMPTGTYFYRFSARGYTGTVEHNGAIEVIR